MIRSDRVRELLAMRGLSQSELARRINVTQGAIAKIVSKNPGRSSHLHRIARELGTTPAYLEGEIDDPAEGAPPPPPASRHQPLMLPVMLPAEAALEAAFLGVLLASEKMDQRELARELAKRLPTVLRLSATARVDPAWAEDEGLPAPEEPPADVRRAQQRASRT